jgi:hypothetical protein
VVQPLIEALRQRPASRGRLSAIINRRTISSALLAALDLRNAGAVLAGEPTGGKPNSYGDQRSFQLPNSRLTVSHPTKYFDLVPGDPPALASDVAISITSDEFFARRDPMLDAIAGVARAPGHGAGAAAGGESIARAGLSVITSMPTLSPT